MGKSRLSGELRDKNNVYKGYIREDGEIRDENNVYKGYIKEDGEIRDENNIYKGYIYEDGDYRDENNIYKGNINSDGDFRDENNSYKGYIKKESSGGCYLTTACVAYKNLGDNCEELEILRGFRDGFMKTNGLDGEIDSYYKKAPKILDGINKLSEEEKIKTYDYIYNVIKGCVALIKNEESIKAYDEYKRMVVNIERNI